MSTLPTTDRATLFSELSKLNFNITLKNLLYGDYSLTVDNNIAAVYKIHDYIKDSNRFQ